MKKKKWNICCLSMILTATLTLPELFALTPETMKSIEHWRTEILPTAEPENYWTTLKEIGTKITEADAQKIEATGSSDVISALAFMAYQVANADDKVGDIAAWYGRTVNRLDQELWESMKERLAAKGLSERDVGRALISGWSPKMRAGPPTMKLIQVVHATEEYLPIWEAWMLSPSSGERYHMTQRINEALAAVGNERTVTILVEKCRVLPTHLPPVVQAQADPTQLQEESRREAGEIRRTIRAIGGEAAVSGLLEYAHIAESAGYAGEGTDGARSFVVYLLSSSRHPHALAENPEWAESLRDPENPSQLMPWDDKWKEFKPIIEEMLENPSDLRPEDIKTLRAALDAMPK